MSQSELAEREQRASRSVDDRRPEADRAKARALSNASGVAVTKTEDLSKADPKTLARALMPRVRHVLLGVRLPGQHLVAGVRLERARGQPELLGVRHPAGAARLEDVLAGPNWEDNAETQIRWGLGYIKGRYGSACSAWSFKQGAGWY